MDKYKSAIYEYEASRQLITDLKDLSGKLIGLCKGGSNKDGSICLVVAYEEVNENIHHEVYDNSYGQTVFSKADYSEVLDEIGCTSCKTSYAIKTGPLADAKKRFGIAKRRLSALGKNITVNTGE